MKQPAREIIAESGRTITSLADEMGVKRGHLQGVLYGVIAPSRAVREKLPELLGVPLENLFTPDLLARQYTGTRPGKAVAK